MLPTSTMPLLPLPGLVLFPRTMIQLHIFEPRYVRMVHDSLLRERRIATASLRPGWQKDYFGTPAVHRTVTAARILHEETLPGNRYNILLEGIERAQLVTEVSAKPYRTAKIAPLQDLMPEEHAARIREARRRLINMAEALAVQLPEYKESLTNLENQHLHPGIIADQVASLLVRDAYERQSLLEQRSVLRRLELVNVRLTSLLAAESNPQFQHEIEEKP